MGYVATGTLQAGLTTACRIALKFYDPLTRLASDPPLTALLRKALPWRPRAGGLPCQTAGFLRRLSI